MLSRDNAHARKLPPPRTPEQRAERGEPLPPPFADDVTAFERLSADDHVAWTVVRSYDGRSDRVAPQHMALPSDDHLTPP